MKQHRKTEDTEEDDEGGGQGGGFEEIVGREEMEYGKREVVKGRTQRNQGLRKERNTRRRISHSGVGAGIA